MHETVIAWVGLGEFAKAAAAPVEITAVDDDAADTGAVSTDVFGEAVDDDLDIGRRAVVEAAGARGCYGVTQLVGG